MPQTLTARSRKNSKATNRWSQLSPLNSHGCDIVIIEREPLCDLTDTIDLARPLQLRDEVNASNINEQPRLMLSQMGIDVPALAQDISDVCRRFLQHFALAAAKLRVELCTTTTCPKFHHDHVQVRMATTYAGATTQYHHVKTPQLICDAPLWSLVFLKGCKHATNDGTILHRSPPMEPGDRRLCVVLDY